MKLLIRFLLVLCLTPVWSLGNTRSQVIFDIRPEEAGMSSLRLCRLDGIINKAILRKEIPGAVVLVSRNNKVVYWKAYGQSQILPKIKSMNRGMIFDLASLTKPLVTAPSVMILVEEGKILLEDKVKTYIPAFAPYVNQDGEAFEDARICHLLTHTSGLPPYIDASMVQDRCGEKDVSECLLDLIVRSPKTGPAGKRFQYSCLGYIVLGRIVEKMSGVSLDIFASKHIFKPLGMANTFFNPPCKIRHLCVPTEVIDKKPLKGEVHDPLARIQGGVSGNAGLFSSASDLAKFVSMLLGKGQAGNTRILSAQSIEKMTSVFPEAKHSGRGLGWDLHSPYSASKGKLFGSNSFGHTGYTGTSIWIDPDNRLSVILLTNRVHPEDQGRINALRAKVADIAAESVLREEEKTKRTNYLQE